MSLIVIAVLMWCATFGLALRMHPGKDATVLVAVASMAISLTLNIDPIYARLDSLAGSFNLVDLAKHTFFVGAIYFLTLGQERVSGASRQGQKRAAVVALSVLAVQTAAFFMIDMHGSTTVFMVTYGDQPAAVIYSLAHFLYFGAALAYTGARCRRALTTQTQPGTRVGIRIFALGTWAAALITIVILARELSRLLGFAELASTCDSAYDVLLVGNVLLVAGGLATPPIAAFVEERKARRHGVTLCARLRDVYAAQMRKQGAPSPILGPPQHSTSDAELLQLTILLDDLVVMGSETNFTDQDRATLSEAREHLSKLRT